MSLDNGFPTIMVLKKLSARDQLTNKKPLQTVEKKLMRQNIVKKINET